MWKSTLLSALALTASVFSEEAPASGSDIKGPVIGIDLGTTYSYVLRCIACVSV